MSAVAAGARFPRLRWFGIVWLLVYLPVYASAYGLRNFLFLCNIGVILTAVALVVVEVVRRSARRRGMRGE